MKLKPEALGPPVQPRRAGAIRSLGRFKMGALLLLLIAGFYWKITLTRQYDWTTGPDLAEQVLPWFQVQAREIHAHRLPLWDQYLWAGQPLPGQAQPGTAYPLNWILFLLPLKNGHLAPAAVQWYFVIIHVMAAAFCYWLCRDLGRSPAAAVAGALIFSLSGFLGNTAWPQMMNGAVWIPLVFLFLLRAAEGNRSTANAALAGMFLGISWLSGHHQVPTFTTLAFGATWLYVIFRMGRAEFRFVKAAVVSFLFAGLTGALQILPAIEYGRLARRWVGAPEPLTWSERVPYSVHGLFDLKPFSLFGIVFPGVHANFDPFIGIVALALAVLAVVAFRRDARVRLLTAIGLGAILYSLGPRTIFQGLLYAILPVLDKARSASAMVVLFQFAAAVLAAFGIDHLTSAPPSPWTRRVMLGVLSFGVLTLAMCQAVLFANKLAFPDDQGIMMTAFLALLVAALFYACRHGAVTPIATAVFLVALLMIELGNIGQSGFVDRSDKNQMTWLNQMRGNEDVAAYLRSQPGFQRAEVAQDAFAPNWGAWHDVEMFGGKGASITYNVLDSELFSLTGRALWGVAYTLASGPQPGAGQEVFAGASGLKVYRRDAFPRVWAVHQLVQAPSLGAGNLLISQDPAAFHNRAYIVQRPPAVEACRAPDRVELVEHFGDRLSIRADMACAGMVVLSDTYYPGWQARVDHRAAAIYEVNGAMRGVLAPRGSHVVTMRYRPASVIAGAILTFLGVAGALLIWGFRGLAPKLRY